MKNKLQKHQQVNNIFEIFISMSTLPFDNVYRLRKVAESDAKSCFICYKPTVTVLVTSNQKDFFYICDSHLKSDKAFSENIYEGSEMAELLKELKGKEEKEKMITFLINEKSSSWNKIMSWTDKRNKADPEDDKSAESKLDNTASPNSSSENGKELRSKSLKELQDKLKSVKREQVELKAKIQDLEKRNKLFKLNKDIFNIRLTNYKKKIYSQKRTEQIQSGNIFPTVPKNDL